MPTGKTGKKGKETPVTLSGSYVFANGDRYEGEYEEIGPGHIVRSGQGTHTSASGTIYVGTWRADVLNGKGEVRHPSGAVYKGDMVEGEYHGEGIFQWPDGSLYSGPFTHNRCEGKGVYTDSSGRQWVGEFTGRSADKLRLKIS